VGSTETPTTAGIGSPSVPVTLAVTAVGFGLIRRWTLEPVDRGIGTFLARGSTSRMLRGLIPRRLLRREPFATSTPPYARRVAETSGFRSGYIAGSPADRLRDAWDPGYRTRVKATFDATLPGNPERDE
jgi:hypothetical protein